MAPGSSSSDVLLPLPGLGPSPQGLTQVAVAELWLRGWPGPLLLLPTSQPRTGRPRSGRARPGPGLRDVIAVPEGEGVGCFSGELEPE